MSFSGRFCSIKALEANLFPGMMWRLAFSVNIRTLGLLHVTFEFYWEYLKEKGHTGQSPDYREGI